MRAREILLRPQRRLVRRGFFFLSSPLANDLPCRSEVFFSLSSPSTSLGLDRPPAVRPMPLRSEIHHRCRVAMVVWLSMFETHIALPPPTLFAKSFVNAHSYLQFALFALCRRTTDSGYYLLFGSRCHGELATITQRTGKACISAGRQTLRTLCNFYPSRLPSRTCP